MPKLQTLKAPIIGERQGAVFPLSLFSLFTHNLSRPITPRDKINTYSENPTIVSQHP